MMGIREVGFGVDDFNRPMVLSETESIKQIVMNVLTGKPGNIPSLPDIGIDIRRYIEYVDPESIDSQELKRLIHDQLSTVLSFDQVGDIVVVSTTLEGQSVLIINIPITSNSDSEIQVAAGFSVNGNELKASIEAGLIED